jgi:hypothetical protein
MIRRMRTRLISALLIIGWVSLSGFDLIEDLKFESERSACSQGAKSHSSQWSRHPGLANNIVESAVTANPDYSPLLRLNNCSSSIQLLSPLHRVLELHKLHRVFLI